MKDNYGKDLFSLLLAEIITPTPSNQMLLKDKCNSVIVDDSLSVDEVMSIAKVINNIDCLTKTGDSYLKNYLEILNMELQKMLLISVKLETENGNQ